MTISHRSLAALIVLSLGISFATRIDEETATIQPTVRQAAVQPEFRLSVLRSEVVLEGHTQSDAHEQMLLSAATELFPDYEITPRFEPLGLVPDHWPDTTMHMLRAISNASSGTANLLNDQLALNVITRNASSWDEDLSALRAELPESIEINDRAIPVSHIEANDMCQRAFAGYDAGTIAFEQSTERFRQSAIPQLDRLVALADACRQGKVRVTGHTDASGNESANQALSLLRAKAVIDYLVARGINADRLLSVGAGSSEPIADNGTRYGRSLNRRIEIEFLQP